ncbi:MAG: hypothetical protein KGH87_01035 [Thaumarchaeota archaeon]|nr:hypothetical protein [Nitrososphaerota archaeon]MDE1838480.1 hypothetical protein [Nitrososphaerota archaeon]
MKTLHLSIIVGVGIVFVIVGLVLVPLFTSKPAGLRFANNPLENIENNCGQFYTIPEKQHDLYTVPVLLMDSNATGCFKLTFTVADTHDTDPTYRLSTLRQELGFRIGNYNVTTNGHSFSIAPGKDHTNSFEIFYMSQTVDNYPANYRIGDDPVYYPTGTNFTETVLIKALPNAKGFYDYSIPGPNCSHYPLSVGYAENQVNSSDFSKVSPLGQTCERSPYEITSVQISGMSYKELKLEPIPFELGK